MHELARQHYLDAMGIQSYMPRLVLPAAPVPTQCDLRGLVDDDAQSQPVVPTTAPTTGPSPDSQAGATVTRAAAQPAPLSEHPEPAATSVDDILASMGAVPAATKAAPKTSSKPYGAAAAEAPAVSFSVSLWQFAGLIVIADRHAEQALPVNLLLKNILVALGRARDRTDNPEVIKWPLAGLPVAQAGPALTYFTSLLLARRLPDQETRLLCFGETIAAQLAPQTKQITQGAFDLPLAEGEAMPAIALPSLEDILRTPSLKATVWRAIAPLRLDS
ncbi:hypothetical protein [Simiduia aestuariiviva]|uniref:Uncharacterized protein n=1 Tax=Simiduia aestuariiviva TaxID=1510459 RepID=A0A839URY4_9GAMM|nr:hypothetical protein [Simiduia aestuariiviva]MBB3169471.1 hypothetical protein [Simiduia aestuariiviva]